MCLPKLHKKLFGSTWGVKWLFNYRVYASGSQVCWRKGSSPRIWREPEGQEKQHVSNRTKLLIIKVILPNRTSGQMHTHPWRQSPQVVWKSFWLNKQYEGEKIRLGGLLLAYIWNSNSFIHVNPLQILAVLCHLWGPEFSCKTLLPEGNLLQARCSGGSSGLKETTIGVIPLKCWLEVLASIWSPGEYPHLPWKSTRKSHYS